MTLVLLAWATWWKKSARLDVWHVQRPTSTRSAGYQIPKPTQTSRGRKYQKDGGILSEKFARLGRLNDGGSWKEKKWYRVLSYEENEKGEYGKSSKLSYKGSSREGSQTGKCTRQANPFGQKEKIEMAKRMGGILRSLVYDRGQIVL